VDFQATDNNSEKGSKIKIGVITQMFDSVLYFSSCRARRRFTSRYFGFTTSGEVIEGLIRLRVHTPELAPHPVRMPYNAS
jgi:hypothetical protein